MNRPPNQYVPAISQSAWAHDDHAVWCSEPVNAGRYVAQTDIAVWADTERLQISTAERARIQFADSRSVHASGIKLPGGVRRTNLARSR